MSQITTRLLASGAVTEAKLASSVAGNGLQGAAGSALSIKLDGSTLSVGASGIKVSTAGITNNEIAASVITGQTAETVADNADMILIYDDSAAALKKMSRSNFVGTAADVNVKVSANDTTTGYLTAKLVAGSTKLSKTINNPGANEQISLDVVPSNISHGDLANLTSDDHSIYIKADGLRPFTGNQSMGSNKLTNVTDPTDAQDAATKAYVDGLIDGRDWKQSVKAATTAAVTLATDLEDGDSIDGVTLATGDRILVKDQSTASENGIYIVAASGAPARASDANAAAELVGAAVFVEQGTANGDKQFAQTGDGGTFAANSVWVVTSANHFSGHDMISLSGGQISVDLATVSGLESSNAGNAAGQLRVKLEASNPTLQIDGSNQLGAKLDAAGAITTGASGLKVKLEASTPSLQISSNELGIKFDTGATGGLSSSADGIIIKALGVTNAMLAGSIADSKLSTISTANKVSGSAVQLNASGALEDSTGLRVKVDSVTTKINGSNQVQGLIPANEEITVGANEYVDLAQKAHAGSVALMFGGVAQRPGIDFTVDNSGAVSRIKFDGTSAPNSDLKDGGAIDLTNGDKVYVSYSYLG